MARAGLRRWTEERSKALAFAEPCCQPAVRKGRCTRFMRCCDMTMPITARPLIVLRLTTSPIQEIGSTPEGTLTIFPVTGGSFEGERLRGKVLAGGGDWVTARSNGMMTLDLRVALETDDGSLIHMTFTRI